MHTCLKDYFSSGKKNSVKLLKLQIFYFDIFKKNTSDLIISQ